MGFPFFITKERKVRTEGMSNLRTNYKDDVFTGKRKYNEIDNGDGSISFDDVTNYSQNGDTYGAAQINEVNDIINNLNNNSYRQTDGAETAIADNDYFPFFDASANAKKKTLWSNLKSILTQVFAIKVHNSNSAGTYGAGNASYFGHVKLSDNYTTSAGAASASVGASSQAVNSTYNRFKGQLTANSKDIYMDYKNGKYGINTSANRGADTFIPFNSLDNAKVASISISGFSIYSKTATMTGFTPGEYYVIMWDRDSYYGDGWTVSLSGATQLLFNVSRRNPFDYWWTSFMVHLVKATSNTITMTMDGDRDFEGAGATIWQLTGV